MVWLYTDRGFNFHQAIWQQRSYMSLRRTKLVSSPVALNASWVGHRDVLVWTLSGRQYKRCVLEESSELQNQDQFTIPKIVEGNFNA